MTTRAILAENIVAAMVTDKVTVKANHDNHPMMDKSTTRKRTTHMVSQVCSQHHAASNCTVMPDTAPLSPCTSDESSDSEASSPASRSVTGNFSNINQKYHICSRVLGKGRHGLARVCMDRATRQRYAVKSIRKTDASVKLDYLAREISLMREMKHCNIIQLVDVFEDAECLHIVTDLCEGGELFDKIVRKSSVENGATCFREDEAARIMHQVIKAVEYMHEQDIAHRDIKPENIMFKSTKEDAQVKIIDFGLAQKHSEGLDPPMTTVVGTPYYIAPEVLKKSYDKACDLWSVGIIAYVILCGYPPFTGKSHHEIHEAILRGQFHFPSDDWQGVSPEARDFISQLLQLDPTKRMTAKQALKHSWLVNEDVDDEERDEESAYHVHGRTIRPRGMANRDVRKAMFGLYARDEARVHMKKTVHPRGMTNRDVRKAMFGI